MYAIVDIETTGGSAKVHRITEIAIIQHDGERETGRYQWLVNPGVPIPSRITDLTGISDEMVKDAPYFREISTEIKALTEGRVFVAHNVNFDYGFIHQHFIELGIKWAPKRLCTVRLSRTLIPGLYSYSLGKIAQQLGYSIEGRHRAMGDCEFTSKLFKILLDRDDQNHIKFALNARSREATLPPNVSREILDMLPKSMGVYTFIGPMSKVIYIGKANNLKDRVIDHFRGNTHTGLKSNFAGQITDVRWELCPNELIALLTEAREIKKFWPPYNRLMKRVSLNWGVFGYHDQRGFGRFSIGKVGKWDKPLHSFRNQHEARLMVERMCKEFELCARYCSLQEAEGRCAEEIHGNCFGACVGEEKENSYNVRYDRAALTLKQGGETMVIHDKGFSEDEQSLILIENGRYKGHGLAPVHLEIESVESVKSYINTGYDDQDMQTIIRSHLMRKPDSKITYLHLA